MVTTNNVAAKMPMEALTDSMGQLQTMVQALSTQVRESQQLQEKRGASEAALVGHALRRQQTRLWWTMVALSAGLALWIGLALWWSKPPVTANFTSAFVVVDSVLVDTWPTLPKDVQTKLELAYRAGGVRSPGTRNK